MYWMVTPTYRKEILPQTLSKEILSKKKQVRKKLDQGNRSKNERSLMEGKGPKNGSQEN